MDDLGGRIQKRPIMSNPVNGLRLSSTGPQSLRTKDSEGNDKEERFFFMKTYQVFNIDHVEASILITCEPVTLLSPKNS